MFELTCAEEIREQCHIQEAQQLDPQGHSVRVTVIQGGRSANDYSYDEQAFRLLQI